MELKLHTERPRVEEDPREFDDLVWVFADLVACALEIHYAEEVVAGPGTHRLQREAPDVDGCRPPGRHIGLSQDRSPHQPSRGRPCRGHGSSPATRRQQHVRQDGKCTRNSLICSLRLLRLCRRSGPRRSSKTSRLLPWRGLPGRAGSSGLPRLLSLLVRRGDGGLPRLLGLPVRGGDGGLRLLVLFFLQGGKAVAKAHLRRASKNMGGGA
mmetsp:Transcript_99554/g.297431  ORF Transcript_99554/g.297431 Transcript_99554/m.297431 type:complete len:211 (+) Transcript_99554:599-1231(+)